MILKTNSIKKADLLFNDEPAMSTINPNKRHIHLEKAIHALAQMDEQPKNEEGNGGNKVLAPFAFTNFVAEGVALAIIISIKLIPFFNIGIHDSFAACLCLGTFGPGCHFRRDSFASSICCRHSLTQCPLHSNPFAGRIPRRGAFSFHFSHHTVIFH
jgi:hypothetical protein